MQYANIIKAIYLNNRLWNDVDTTSINGVLDCWGVTPSMIEFNLNRHFDSHKDDAGNAKAEIIRHLDNIKLVIIPESDFYDRDGIFGGALPTVYNGNGNYPPTPNTLDDYLRWQGVYVDPTLNFAADSQMNFTESFDITCYDYRWCLNNTLFRTPPLLKRVWESGDNTSGTDVELIGWNIYGTNGDSVDANGNRIFPEPNNNNKIHGYEFTYNDFLPETSCEDNAKSWVEIVEHIIRTHSYNYNAVTPLIENSGWDDPGSFWPHIPKYTDFDVIPTFAGLRINSDGNELFLNAFARWNVKQSFDYDPLASQSDTPFAHTPQSEVIDRSFKPDPITISNTKFLNAIQNVLDAVGTFEMYMDQYNTLHFVRQIPPNELEIPEQSENPTGNVFDKIYVARFADNRADLSISADELKWYGVRSISSLKPRAVPEANRVIGLLRGRAPLAHDIINDSHSGDLEPNIPFFTAVMWASDAYDEEKDARNDSFITAHKKEFYSFTDKVYAATAVIAKPTITAFLHRTEKSDGSVIHHTLSNAIPGGWLLHKGRLLINANGNYSNPIETVVKKKNGDKDYYRYSVGYTKAVASVSIVNAKSDDDGDVAGGGHAVALNEDAVSVFTLYDKIEVDDTGETINTSAKFVAITHSWSVDTKLNSKHRKQFVTNQPDADDDDSAICLYAMGTAPSSEVFSIDSSFQKDDFNDWGDLQDNTGIPTTQFPGLGEFDRAVIDAPVIVKTVEELTPQYTVDDDISWVQRWDEAKRALMEIVKNTAMKLRQLITVGGLPHLYDPQLKLDHRLVIWGTRDDIEKNEQHWMRLNSMKSRINAIKLTTDDELVIELTTERALPEFSFWQMAQNK